MSLIHAGRIWEAAPRAGSGRIGRLAFLAGLALTFAASLTATIANSLAMTGMGGIPMPGGWMMSMMWLPVCGQGWPSLAASFLLGWLAMMAAMMLPVLAPVLWRYRQGLAKTGEAYPGCLAAMVGLGYFTVWSGVGIVLFVSGAGFATIVCAMPALARIVPLAAGLVVLSAGLLQFTAWKARHLACWQGVPDIEAVRRARALGAWRYGLGLGVDCGRNCAGLTAILLVAGMMDLPVMAAVTAVIAAERLAPNKAAVARFGGGAIIGAALVSIVRAVSL